MEKLPELLHEDVYIVLDVLGCLGCLGCLKPKHPEHPEHQACDAWAALAGRVADLFWPYPYDDDGRLTVAVA